MLPGRLVVERERPAVEVDRDRLACERPSEDHKTFGPSVATDGSAAPLATDESVPWPAAGVPLSISMSDGGAAAAEVEGTVIRLRLSWRPLII